MIEAMRLECDAQFRRQRCPGRWDHRSRPRRTPSRPRTAPAAAAQACSWVDRVSADKSAPGMVASSFSSRSPSSPLSLSKRAVATWSRNAVP